MLITSRKQLIDLAHKFGNSYFPTVIEKRENLPTVVCLWTFSKERTVMPIRIISVDNGSILGNPSGYDDWACELREEHGFYNGNEYYFAGSAEPI